MSKGDTEFEKFVKELKQHQYTDGAFFADKTGFLFKTNKGKSYFMPMQFLEQLK